MRTIRDFRLLFHVVRLCSLATIMTSEKENVNESLKYKCFMCSSLCSANERIYIFWKCLIVSVNKRLKASHKLKTGEKSSIQNSLSTNRAKLLDFLVPFILGKLKAISSFFTMIFRVERKTAAKETTSPI